MIRIDAFYLYSCGYYIHPIESLKGDAPFQEWHLPLIIALGTVRQLVFNSVFQLETSQAAATKLINAIESVTKDAKREAPITLYEAYGITSALSEFEHVLTAELGVMNIYVIRKKRGYITTDLILNGWMLFPEDLGAKVPEAIADVNAATRCIAFELQTAAAFHLHRANESVLHAYYDAVTGGAPRPAGRNVGDYIATLTTAHKGDAVILSALKELKDLHRNPLIHPEQSLDSIDDAIALLGGIQAVIVPMLKAIPASPPLAVAGASAVP